MCHFLRGAAVLSISENKCGCSKLRQVYHKSLFIKCRPGNHGSNPPKHPPHNKKKRQQLFSPACCCPKGLGGWLPSKPQWKETIDGERTPTVPCFLCAQCPLRHSPPSSGTFEKTKRNFPIPLPIFCCYFKRDVQSCMAFLWPFDHP